MGKPGLGQNPRMVNKAKITDGRMQNEKTKCVHYPHDTTAGD
jgi:hypothetical protein